MRLILINSSSCTSFIFTAVFYCMSTLVIYISIVLLIDISFLFSFSFPRSHEATNISTSPYMHMQNFLKSNIPRNITFDIYYDNEETSHQRLFSLSPLTASFLSKPSSRGPPQASLTRFPWFRSTLLCIVLREANAILKKKKSHIMSLPCIKSTSGSGCS